MKPTNPPSRNLDRVLPRRPSGCGVGVLIGQSAKSSLRVAMVLTAGVVILMFTSMSKADQITLRNHVKVDGPQVQLKDVATLQGDAATSLGDLSLGTLTDNGLVISLAQIRTMLDEKGVNWGKLSLRGFMDCKVTAEAAPKAPEPAKDTSTEASSGNAAANPPAYVASDSLLTVGDQVTAVLIKHSGFAKDDLRVTFSPRDTQTLNRSVLVDRWEIEPLNSARLGRVLVTVRQWRDNRIAQTWYLTADVARRALCVVAKNSLKRNDIVTAKDVEIQEVYLQDDHHQPAVKLQDVVGQMATQNLDRGQVLYVDQMARPDLVKRGDRLAVRCIVGGMVIKIAARAMESGAMDDTISVANVDSNERFNVQIVGLGQAVLPTVKSAGAAAVKTSGTKEKKS